MVVNSIIERELVRLQSLQKLLECFMLRIILCKKDYALKTEYEKNEMDILVINTNSQIDLLADRISQQNKAVGDVFGMYLDQYRENDTTIE